MKRLQILGTGCTACDKLARMTHDVATELNLEFTLERVGRIEEIMTWDILSTPALVVDGEVKVYGRVPSSLELREMLTG